MLNKPDYGDATIVIAQKYECVCKLCGKRTEIISSDLRIESDEFGYRPKVHCECHTVSSFEAKTMDILNSLGIKYVREVVFDDLCGKEGKALRFDLGIYKECEGGNPSFDMLIELQGPHHYKEGYYDEDGVYVETNGNQRAEDRLKIQMEYDRMKEEYCRKHSICLKTIKYTSGNDYSKLKKSIIKALEKLGYAVFDPYVPPVFY